MINLENEIAICEVELDARSNLKKSTCGLCGENHSYRDCNFLKITNHIPDKKIPSKARLSLPDFLEIRTLCDGSHEIFTKSDIKKGTEFGPFQAKKLFTLNPCINFPLKLFLSNEEDFLEYFLDNSDEHECSWMIFVSSAITCEEQNLVCYQENDNIYYSTLKDVIVGETLKVWYSPHYAEKMKTVNPSIVTAPILNSQPAEDQIDVNVLVQNQQKIMSRDTWNCKFCGKIDINIVSFASHLLEHYQAQMRKKCEICNDVFATRKLLKNHLKVFHASTLLINTTQKNETKKPLKTNKKRKENSVGGPLLNDLLTDSLDNSNLLLQQTDLNQFDINNIANQSMLLESDNLSVDNLLNENVKALDHFNFELNDAEEQIVCDICLKTFNKLRSLIQHLKQHTGQFHCPKCNKIFCRKENLMGHTCLKFYSLKCNLCDKLFFQKKYLTQHMLNVHNKKFRCDNCDKNYATKAVLNNHNCAKIPNHQKQKFSCNLCEKVFLNEKYLKYHQERHQAPKKREKNICDICCKIYLSKKSYINHLSTHQTPSHQCQICDKMFFRVDLLNFHVLSHAKDTYSEECPICKKKIKSKKRLTYHMKSHTSERKHKCDLCGVSFKFRTSLLKHQKTTHSQKPTRNLEWQVYDCPKCNKKMKLKSSITRHLKQFHSEYYNEIYEQNIKPRTVKLRKDFNSKSKNLVDASNFISVEKTNENQLNIMETIDNMDFSDMGTSCNGSNDINIEDMLNSSENIDSLLGENSDKIVENLLSIATEKEIARGANEAEIREVCLSMPDLTDSDQEIQLGQNAYILENGTIVEPQDNKVVIYVLDPKFP